ncbi:hypothetical protein [Verrucomicrobium sp. BvORR106]|uniref:hypothetical protein n=1 Tax=Verrucomicrobium sp. BvORR106 TaxID=1403819 RepID=UPI000571659B|nr:hypothetical protein [Verrucomicrobium sp. BvORR106]
MKTFLLLSTLTALFMASAPVASAADPKPYPLKTCVVSDDELGTMGKPYEFTHDGQQIKLCCKSCLKKFKADPAKYLSKIKGS